MGIPGEKTRAAEAAASTGRAIAVGAGFAAALALLAIFVDAPLARLLGAVGKPPKFFDPLIDPISLFGQGTATVAAALVIWRLDPRWRRVVVTLFVAMAFSALAATFLKMLTSRARPSEFIETGAMWKAFAGFASSRFNSFPSAHSASAFAFAAVLAAAYPRASVVLYVFAALCAVSRILTHQHYPSDVLAGAALGVWSARWALRSRWTARLAGESPEPQDAGA